MARKLDPKAIKDRIKENTNIMKNAKKDLTEFLRDSSKGVLGGEKGARSSLTNFIKATNAIVADNEKLASLTEVKD